MHYEVAQAFDAQQQRERSANACHVAAGVLQSLGEALGDENEDAETFLLWASELQTHVRHLRARSTASDGVCRAGDLPEHQ